MTIQPDNHLLPSKAVKARFGGISDMTLWRWTRDPNLAFPQPITINKRKYWRAADLADFEARQSS